MWLEGRGVNWVGGWRRTWKRCPENFKILKKQLRLNAVSARLGFSDVIKADQFGFRPAEMSWDLRHHKTCSVCVWGGGDQHSMVSIYFYDLCVSLSSGHEGLRVERNKLVRTACICIFIQHFEDDQSIRSKKLGNKTKGNFSIKWTSINYTCLRFIWPLIIFDRFASNFKSVSEEIFEIFFLHLKSFFWAGSL